jgi:hypothetical protein
LLRGFLAVGEIQTPKKAYLGNKGFAMIPKMYEEKYI